MSRGGRITWVRWPGLTEWFGSVSFRMRFIMNQPDIPPEFNYLKNMICGAKNGFPDDIESLKRILRAAPNHAPDDAVIKMAELFLRLCFDAI